MLSDQIGSDRTAGSHLIRKSHAQLTKSARLTEAMGHSSGVLILWRAFVIEAIELQECLLWPFRWRQSQLLSTEHKSQTR